MNLHLRIAVFRTVALMVFSFVAIEKSNQKSYDSSAKGIYIALIILITKKSGNCLFRVISYKSKDHSFVNNVKKINGNKP
jgi:hypothetical protein